MVGWDAWYVQTLLFYLLSVAPRFAAGAGSALRERPPRARTPRATGQLDWFRVGYLGIGRLRLAARFGPIPHLRSTFLARRGVGDVSPGGRPDSLFAMSQPFCGKGGARGEQPATLRVTDGPV